jgi:DNA invertase Pin-like site-specific DNA recombinase
MDFKAGLYLRLSREDDNKEDLSESIKNQQSFLLTYAQQNNFTIVDIYIDDGYSGTNFDRPAFKEMIKDECYTHYNQLSKVTGYSIDDLKNRFEPYVKGADYTIKNTYEFLMENNALDKYINLVFADESYDTYKVIENLAQSGFKEETNNNVSNIYNYEIAK